jgi:hypothetical protein
MTVLISHIPKTAGSSLHQFVRRFNPDTTYAYRSELSLIDPNLDFALAFRNAPKPAIIMGHFSFGVHRMLGIEPAYVTILREPIARVVSFYRYQRTLLDSAFAAHFKAGMSLREFVSKNISEMTNNHMCRCIAGITTDADPVITDEWLLHLALHNLRRHYVLVGMREHFEQFVSALARRMNWSAYDIPRQNVTAGDPVELDDDTEQRSWERMPSI